MSTDPTAPDTFDRHAHGYNETVNATLGAAGESVEFFAEIKAHLVARELGSESRARILDFGCGIGNATRALQRVFPNARLMGCDHSAESLRVARQAIDGPPIEYVELRGNTLPFEDGSFDVVFASNVFHHIDRAQHVACARELKRVLTPRGTMLIFEHNPYNPLTRRVVAACPFDRGVILLAPPYLERVMHEAGLRPSRPRFYFFFPRFLAALRPLERFLTSLPIGAQYYVRGVS